MAETAGIWLAAHNSRILYEREFLLTDGNAAASTTNFFSSIDDFCRLPWDVLKAKSWIDNDDGKRKMCAEVLVYPSVPATYITALHFYKLPPDNILQAIEVPKQESLTLFFEVAT